MARGRRKEEQTATTWEEALTTWDPGMVKCRAWHHMWEDYTVDTPMGKYVVTQECKRCGNFRKMTMDSRGRIVERWKFQYAEGYLVKGLGTMDQDVRAAIRMAAVGGLRVVRSRRRAS